MTKITNCVEIKVVDCVECDSMYFYHTKDNKFLIAFDFKNDEWQFMDEYEFKIEEYFNPKLKYEKMFKCVHNHLNEKREELGLNENSVESNTLSVIYKVNSILSKMVLNNEKTEIFRNGFLDCVACYDKS